MKKYFPILVSKAGELTALSNLTSAVKDDVAPVIQVLPDSYDRVEAFLPNWSFSANEVYLDFSLCNPFDGAATRSLILGLINGGVNVIPVVQGNSNTQYTAIIQNLIASGDISLVCIRFSNSSGGFINITGQIATILGSLGIGRNQSSILLDFGFIEAHNYNNIAALATSIILGINNRSDFTNLILASSSFLENLSSLTPAGRLYRMQRYEWDIWQTLQAIPGLVGTIKYGDYGTKYPFYSEANFQGSCSIKYTLPSEFIVYRGEISGNHPQGNGQYNIFADRLVRSVDYSGAGFSWGDAQIDFYAGQLNVPNKKTGNATSWVQISQNHHITLLNSLL